MIVKIKLIDDSLPVPSYQTSGSAAIDLYSRLDLKIAPKMVALVPLNVILQIPENYWVLMAARSSLHKRGLMLINGIGVGDYDYRGENDEYHAALFNFSEQAIEISKGDRLVQAIVLPREKVEFSKIDVIAKDDKNRGGFGSTG
jgi:dUTP pyrophosphatase